MKKAQVPRGRIPNATALINRKKVIVEMVFGFEFKKIDWLRIDFTPFS